MGHVHRTNRELREDEEFPVNWDLFAQQVLYSLVTTSVLFVTYLAIHRYYTGFADAAAQAGKQVKFLAAIEARLGYEHTRAENKYWLYRFAWVQVLSSLGTLALWVAKTYRHTVTPVMQLLDYAFCSLFVVHFLVDSAQHRWKPSFVVSIEGLVDIFTIVPLLLQTSVIKTWLSLAFLRVARVLTAFELLSHEGALNRLSVVHRGLSVSAMRFVALVVIMAGSLYVLEALGDLDYLVDEGILNDHLDPISFYRMVFFTFVTISTVGYGDFTPATVIGRLFAIGFILAGVIFFSVETGRIFELRSSEEQGDGKLSLQRRKLRHIVVFGSAVSDSSVVTVRAFLEEIVFSAPTPSFVPQILLMAHKHITEEFRQLISLPWARKHVTWLRGSPVNPDDLDRCHVYDAEMVFILADISAVNPDIEDQDNIMRALAVVRQFPHVVIRLMLLRPENRLMAVRCGLSQNSCYAVNELKASILAQTAMIRTFSSVLINMCCRGDFLFRGLVNEAYVNDRRNNVHEADRRWLLEYAEGAGHEIYLIQLDEKYEGRGCTQVARELYLTAGVLFLAIQENGQVLLNPGDKVKVGRRSAVYVVTSEEWQLSKVALKPDQRQAGEPSVREVFFAEKGSEVSVQLEDAQRRTREQMQIRTRFGSDHDDLKRGGRREKEAAAVDTSNDRHDLLVQPVLSLPLTMIVNMVQRVNMAPAVAQSTAEAKKARRPAGIGFRHGPHSEDDHVTHTDDLFDSVEHEETLDLWVAIGGHIVVLLADKGLWQQLVAFMQLLHTKLVPVWKSIVIVTPSKPPPHLYKLLEGVLWVYSAVNDADILVKAGVATAERVVVFPGHPSSTEVSVMDQSMLLIVNHLEGLLADMKCRKVEYVTELHNPDSVQQFTRPSASRHLFSGKTTMGQYRGYTSKGQYGLFFEGSLKSTLRSMSKSFHSFTRPPPPQGKLPPPILAAPSPSPEPSPKSPTQVSDPKSPSILSPSPSPLPESSPIRRSNSFTYVSSSVYPEPQEELEKIRAGPPPQARAEAKPVPINECKQDKRLHPRYAAGHVLFRPDMVRLFANAHMTPGILELFEGICMPYYRGQQSMVYQLEFKNLQRLFSEDAYDRGEDPAIDVTKLSYGEVFTFLSTHTKYTSDVALPFAIIRTSPDMGNPLDYPFVLPGPATRIFEGDTILVIASPWWARSHIHKTEIIQLLHKKGAARRIWNAWRRWARK